MNSKCFENYICPYLPLSQIIASDESKIHHFRPDHEVVSRIFANMARIYRLLFIIFFVIGDIFLIWVCIPLFLQTFQTDILLFFIFFFFLFLGTNIYLLLSFFKIKPSQYSAISSSEYLLTNTKLYLKMTRISSPGKKRPQPCRLRIIELPLIRSLKLFYSFWDKRYKQTGSLRIKLARPYRSLTLHNINHPEKVMQQLTKVLNSLEK